MFLMRKKKKDGTNRIKIKLLKPCEDLMICPYCLKIPDAISLSPKSKDGDIYFFPQDSNITITFNKPVNKSDFIDENGKLKNVKIYADTQDLLDESNNKSPYYQNPVFNSDNTVLTINCNRNVQIIGENELISSKEIAVSINTEGLKDNVDGEKLSFNKNISWSFRVNRIMDQIEPTITEINFYRDKEKTKELSIHDLESLDGKLTENISVKDKIYITAKAKDTGGYVKSLLVSEKLIYIEGGNKEVNYLVKNVEKGPFTKLSETEFEIDTEYELSQQNKGIFELEVMAVDYAGNVSTTIQKIVFIKSSSITLAEFSLWNELPAGTEEDPYTVNSINERVKTIYFTAKNVLTKKEDITIYEDFESIILKTGIPDEKASKEQVIEKTENGYKSVLKDIDLSKITLLEFTFIDNFGNEMTRIAYLPEKILIKNTDISDFYFDGKDLLVINCNQICSKNIEELLVPKKYKSEEILYFENMDRNTVGVFSEIFYCRNSDITALIDNDTVLSYYNKEIYPDYVDGDENNIYTGKLLYYNYGKENNTKYLFGGLCNVVNKKIIETQKPSFNDFTFTYEEPEIPNYSGVDVHITLGETANKNWDYFVYCENRNEKLIHSLDFYINRVQEGYFTFVLQAIDENGQLYESPFKKGWYNGNNGECGYYLNVNNIYNKYIEVSGLKPCAESNILKLDENDDFELEYWIKPYYEGCENLTEYEISLLPGGQSIKFPYYKNFSLNTEGYAYIPCSELADGDYFVACRFYDEKNNYCCKVCRNIISIKNKLGNAITLDNYYYGNVDLDFSLDNSIDIENDFFKVFYYEFDESTNTWDRTENEIEISKDDYYIDDEDDSENYGRASLEKNKVNKFLKAYLQYTKLTGYVDYDGELYPEYEQYYSEPIYFSCFNKETYDKKKGFAPVSETGFIIDADDYYLAQTLVSSTDYETDDEWYSKSVFQDPVLLNGRDLYAVDTTKIEKGKYYRVIVCYADSTYRMSRTYRVQ